MSFDESDYAREQYEAEIADQALKENGLEYVLENHFREVRKEVEDVQASEWLDGSRNFLQLINIVSEHDREQLRSALLRRAYGREPEQVTSNTELHLFNLASDISKLLESVSKPSHDGNAGASQPGLVAEYLKNHKYGYRPGPPVGPLAHYAQYCTLDDLAWVPDLIELTRAFREILFAISDPERSLEWELSNHIRTIDAALEKGTRPRLVYRGLDAKRHMFGREPNPPTTPLSSLLASWMSDYLGAYSDRIDLGACVECGKIFPRQRRDNSYCSKTCQNRVAYKRRKIFEGGLLQKIELTPRTVTEKLREGVWAYHARLGLGLVESVVEKYGPSVRVRFPQIVRTFHGKDLFQSGADFSKIEFYLEKDPVTLAELL
jgi:hypothetical protein